MNTPLLVCEHCGEANVRGTLRCARCGAALGAPRASTSFEESRESAPSIGGLKIDAPITRRLHGGRLSKRRGYALVLALFVALIALLQFAPTKNARPSPVSGLRVLTVTSHSISVSWLSPKSTGDGLDHFTVTVAPADYPMRKVATKFTIANSATINALGPRTTFKISVSACARNAECSKVATFYATTAQR